MRIECTKFRLVLDRETGFGRIEAEDVSGHSFELRAEENPELFNELCFCVVCFGPEQPIALTLEVTETEPRKIGGYKPPKPWPSPPTTPKPGVSRDRFQQD